MNKFLIGLAVGYLTMTDRGQELTRKMTDGLKKDVEGYLKKEGVIEEPIKTARPSQSDESSSEFQEQPSSNETINE